MYTGEEREGILWEFRRSGLSAKCACETIPLFPTRNLLGLWLGLETAGELEAREMPGRPARMHCSHGDPGWPGPASADGARRTGHGWSRSSWPRPRRCWTS